MGDSAKWLERHVYGVKDRAEYMKQLGECRVADLKTKQHAFAVATDYGY